MFADASSGTPPCSVAVAALDGDQPKSSWSRLAQMGVRHVQLSATQSGTRPRELDRSSRRGLRTDLQRREMTASGIDLWIPPAHFTEARHIDKAVASVLGSIELAGDLGRCPVSLTLPGVTDDGDAGLAQTVVSHAERFGVRIANHALKAIDDDSHHAIGVGIDPPAWLAAGEDPASAVSRAGDRLVSARLCDLLLSGMRGPIGDPADARLDVMRYRVALSVSGCEAPIIIDARQWVDPWGGIERTLHAWQSTH